MKKITQNLKWLVTLLTMIVSMGAWAEETGTITFGNNGTKINGASVTGLDTQENTWTITTVGTTSFTAQTEYHQVGSSSKPATSITFTTTLAEDVTITAFSAKFGGFNGTAGTVTLKVGNTTVGTGSLNGSNDVTVSSTTSETGKVLTVTVTGISKGVKCYNITYTYSSASGKQNSQIAWSASEASATMGINFNNAPTLSNPHNLQVTYNSSDTEVATIGNNGAITLVGAGTTTISAVFVGDDTYDAKTVSYELTVSKQDVTLSFSETSFNIDFDDKDSFVEPTLTGIPEGLTVTYSSNKTDVATVDATTGDVTIVGKGSVQITATFVATPIYNGASKTYTINVTGTYKKANGYYALVTDASTLAAGDEIIFVYVDTNKKVAMSTDQKDNNRNETSIEDATWSESGEVVEISQDDVQALTLEASGNYWLFNTGNGYLYAASSSSNYLRTEATADANAEAEISISGGNAAITFQGSASRNKLKYNSSSSLFSCYSSGQKDVKIYRKAETVDVTVTEGGALNDMFYATYSNAEKALDFSAVEGLKAYYVTSASTSALTITEASKVPAGTAVLIEGAEAKTYQVPVVTSGTDDASNNRLLVSNGNVLGDGQTIYVLGNGKNGVGFYLKKKDYAIAAGKAYLEIAAGEAKSFLSLGGDDAVAISNVETEQGTGILYNLNGQRVAAPVKGGLYIMNGKKVLVK